jgi:hypothetical protein
MTLKIKQVREKHECRLCLSGALRCTNVVDLRAEIRQMGQPAILDLEEVNIVDIEGVRFLNECCTQGIQVVNCSPYIREWMLQEKQLRRDEK